MAVMELKLVTCNIVTTAQPFHNVPPPRRSPANS